MGIHTDFDTGEKTILNEFALSEKKPDEIAELFLELEFEHEGSVYTVSRKQQYRRAEERLDAEAIGQSVPRVTWVDASGKFQHAQNPANRIDRIIPKKMHSYFFFNGERIEKLANVSAAGEISDAIRTLMGLEIVERASDHLDRLVIKDLRKEARETASSEYRELLSREEKAVNARDRHEEDKKTAEANHVGYLDEIDKINESYVEISEVKAKVEQRRSLENENQSVKDDLEELRKARMEAISRTGALAFLKDTIGSVSKKLEDCRRRGELPYKIRRTFVDDLLHKGTCICGSELAEETDQRKAVEAYRDRATGEDLEAAFTETVGNLNAMPRERARLYKQTAEWAKKESALEQRIKEISEALDEISGTLGSSGIEDVERLEKRRRELGRLEANEQVEIAKAKDAIRQCDEDLDGIRKAKEKVETKSKKEGVARRRLEFAESCETLVDNVYKWLAEDTRKQLSERVNETFQSILRKDFHAEIDSDYTLKIFKDLPGIGKQPVSEKSTGENQAISLSFIASLVSLAKERKQAKISFFEGGVFPIIMDSPFGALDREYREKIAEHIPQLADQVVIFASNSQWSKEVDEKCRPYIGKEYSLVYHAPKSAGRQEDNSYVKRTDGPEFTTIEEGYLGR